MAYLLALLIGLGCALQLPWVMVQGGGWWLAPGGDIAQSLLGHLAFQVDDWRFPLFRIASLMPPKGVNALLLDANPLVSLLAKLLPGGPHNLLGWWLFACFAAQPVAAAYALRGLGERRIFPALAVAALAALMPSLWFRPMHPNLCGHFAVLLALGATLRLLRGQPGWGMAVAALLLGAFTHPYLLVMTAALLCAVPLQAALARNWPGLRRAGLPLALALGGTAGLMALAGFFGAGAGDRGFGRFSMNLLSPVAPQFSGLFGGTMLDATGGQYEGFNYLGAGALVVVALAWHRPPRWMAALLMVLAGLTLLALSSRIYAGPVLLFDLGLKPWEDIFGAIRASGRLFWPVGYAALIVALAVLAARLRPMAFGLLCMLAVGLQWLDTAPLRARAYDMMASPTAALPPPGFAEAVAAATRLTFLPAAPCVMGAERDLAQSLALVAVRLGIPVSSVPAGRMPAGFGCEAAASDAVETPLHPGELRLVLEHDFLARLDARLLGAGTGCLGDLPRLCGQGLGTPLPASLPPAMPARGQAFDLRPFQAHGWAGAWNAGPRSTLLLPAGGGALELRLRGVALNAGGTRQVSLRVNDGPATEWRLADMAEVTQRILLPEGAVRITFDVPRPVDPQRRGLGPVAHRVGMQLISATLVD
jgi:hypothetical protein